MNSSKLQEMNISPATTITSAVTPADRPARLTAHLRRLADQALVDEQLCGVGRAVEVGVGHVHAVAVVQSAGQALRPGRRQAAAA